MGWIRKAGLLQTPVIVNRCLEKAYGGEWEKFSSASSVCSVESVFKV